MDFSRPGKEASERFEKRCHFYHVQLRSLLSRATGFRFDYANCQDVKELPGGRVTSELRFWGMRTRDASSIIKVR